MPRRLTVGRQALNLNIVVRIHAGQQRISVKHRFGIIVLSYGKNNYF